MVEIWLLVGNACKATARISSVLHFIMLILCFQTQLDALLQYASKFMKLTPVLQKKLVHDQLSNWIKIRIKF